MKHRTPEGKFCTPEAMLGHWLPKLLSWQFRNYGIPEMLELARAHCMRKAGKILLNGGQKIYDIHCVSNPAGTFSGDWRPDYHIKEYRKLVETADALARAKAQIAEIWK